MIGVQIIKTHKSDSNVCYTFDTEWTGALLTKQLKSGVSVFAHVCEQTLDTLSYCCNNSNIYSAIGMKLSFLTYIEF